MTSRFAAFVPASVMLAGVLLVSGIRAQYALEPARTLASIPASMLGHASQDVVIDKEEQRIAGMSHYVLREFRQDSATAFSVYVGYYDRQVQGKTIHSPKNCLPGAGWEILTSSRVPLPGSTTGGTANRVVLSNKGTRAMVYYWYQGRGREESSEYKVKWDLLRDAALYGRTEEALVRIVVPIGRAPGNQISLDDDKAVIAADQIAKQVAGELTPSVRELLPKFPSA